MPAPELDPDSLIDTTALRVMWPEIPASTIRWWAHTGRLKRRGTDHRGRILYRLGDILELRSLTKP